MIILADTGILLRLFNTADPLHSVVDTASRVIRRRGDKLGYALQNAAEFGNVCTRPATSRGGLGLSIQEADRRLKMVESSFTLFSDPASIYSDWRRLLTTHGVKGKQVHDARLVALMNLSGM